MPRCCPAPPRPVCATKASSWPWSHRPTADNGADGPRPFFLIPARDARQAGRPHFGTLTHTRQLSPSAHRCRRRQWRSRVVAAATNDSGPQTILAASSYKGGDGAEVVRMPYAREAEGGFGAAPAPRCAAADQVRREVPRRHTLAEYGLWQPVPTAAQASRRGIREERGTIPEASRAAC